jgi:hypothetical protein
VLDALKNSARKRFSITENKASNLQELHAELERMRNGFACEFEEHELHIRHLLQRRQSRMPLASGNVGKFPEQEQEAVAATTSWAQLVAH